jgi:hypothetical protein
VKACSRSRFWKERTGGPAADHHWDEERGPHRLAGEDERVAVALGHLRRALGDHQRLAGLHRVLAEAAQLDGVVGEANTALDRVREVEQARRLVVDTDSTIGRRTS